MCVWHLISKGKKNEYCASAWQATWCDVGNAADQSPVSVRFPTNGIQLRKNTKLNRTRKLSVCSTWPACSDLRYICISKCKLNSRCVWMSHSFSRKLRKEALLERGIPCRAEWAITALICLITHCVPCSSAHSTGYHKCLICKCKVAAKSACHARPSASFPLSLAAAYLLLLICVSVHSNFWQIFALLTLRRPRSKLISDALT